MALKINYGGVASGPILRREWAMPNSKTFSIKPISNLLDTYLDGKSIIVDPFARDSKRGTITNDLNPDTSAEFHMDAKDFCQMLVDKQIQAEAVLFDPPYSPRQIAECYNNVGIKATMQDTQISFYSNLKDKLAHIIVPGGVAISFGWNTNGFGMKRGFRIVEILCVAHGSMHNDTLVTVERKI